MAASPTHSEEFVLLGLLTDNLEVRAIWKFGRSENPSFEPRPGRGKGEEIARPACVREQSEAPTEPTLCGGGGGVGARRISGHGWPDMRDFEPEATADREE